MPAMMYGTAWKKEQTADLVHEAIRAGFRGIDTAAMKRHYDEALTGDGIRRAIADGLVTRADLYIQTKFTPGDDAYADREQYPTIASQVRASVASSLRNLSTAGDGDSSSDYLDCLVMHSPYADDEDTLAAWAALAELVPAGGIRAVGISNVTLPVLEVLASSSSPYPPSVVQNRFRRAERAWDADVRQWCAARGVAYQGFWTLTGNRAEWKTAPFVRHVADAAAVPLATAWYALLQAVGIVVLNGTTNPDHMRDDLAGLRAVAEWRAEPAGADVWARSFAIFKQLIGME
ncbi:NADP-dependent oxidoreductase domain-containing protein [Lasiosphaeria miniovina]|uniref:NADP-dependent oxidoreductase domain-containing protein n=1 Tax=Lasiosphaeria miniovina TaxID=1954250 RepID=A0AA40A053_9PEZI|nr:NADP-dependent oxidoreductase domain-containing protein [Lasiosphaeria miniovina]KAK0706841.1 NADP-dependent oxidoreductase domain-containing protein [Lasiosphaeria miniovina]